MLALTLTLALLASSANARFMPLHRFASLEGMAVDSSDSDAAARPPRHALDFAAFDRPLSPDPHHRVARGAAEAGDCADDADLMGHIVETAPDDMEETLDVPVYQSPPRSAQFVECPEELHGTGLSTDDVKFDDDLAATLGKGGVEPLLEAADEAGAWRPARETSLTADKVEAADEQAPEEGAEKVEAADEQAPEEGAEKVGAADEQAPEEDAEAEAAPNPSKSETSEEDDIADALDAQQAEPAPLVASPASEAPAAAEASA